MAVCNSCVMHAWRILDVGGLTLLDLSLVVTCLVFIAARFLRWRLNTVNFGHILVAIHNSLMIVVQGALHHRWRVLLLNLLLLLLHILRLLLTRLNQAWYEFLKLVLHTNGWGHLRLLWRLSGGRWSCKVISLSLVCGGHYNSALLLWLSLRLWLLLLLLLLLLL